MSPGKLFVFTQQTAPPPVAKELRIQLQFRIRCLQRQMRLRAQRFRSRSERQVLATHMFSFLLPLRTLQPWI